MTGVSVGSKTSGHAANRWSIRQVFLLVPWIAIGIAAFQPIKDNSFLWHVRAGDLQLRAGEVLRSDPFSFTAPDTAWRTQSWLVELMYGWLERQSGLAFVPIWLSFCAVVLMALIGVRLKRAGFSLTRVAIGLIALTWIGTMFFVPRPVLISFVFLAMLIVIMDSQSMRWMVPLVLWIWAASHGSFVLGLGYIVLCGLMRRDRGAWRAIAFGVIAVSMTAHGLAVWEILWQFITNRDALSFISEWAPPDPLSIGALPFFVGVLVLLGRATLGKVSFRALWVIGPFMIYGLTSQRALFPAMIVLIVWMIPEVPRLDSRQPSSSPALVIAAATVIVLLPLLSIGSAGRLDTAIFPVAAAEHLTAGPTFHDDAVGGFLIYSQGPERKVFVDDRAELYGAPFFAEVARIRLGASEWRQASSRWGINQALLDQSDLLTDELRSAGWIEVFADEQYAVLRKS